MYLKYINNNLITSVHRKHQIFNIKLYKRAKKKNEKSVREKLYKVVKLYFRA